MVYRLGVYWPQIGLLSYSNSRVEARSNVMMEHSSSILICFTAVWLKSLVLISYHIHIEYSLMYLCVFKTSQAHHILHLPECKSSNIDKYNIMIMDHNEFSLIPCI